MINLPKVNTNRPPELQSVDHERNARIAKGVLELYKQGHTWWLRNDENIDETYCICCGQELGIPHLSTCIVLDLVEMLREET